MSASRPGRVPGSIDHDQPAEFVPFAAVDLALDRARQAVVRATACWVSWAQQTSQVIEASDGAAAWAAAWVRLRHIYAAVELAEETLSDAQRQLTAARCPGCAHPVIPGERIYDTDGTPHTCAQAG